MAKMNNETSVGPSWDSPGTSLGLTALTDGRLDLPFDWEKGDWRRFPGRLLHRIYAPFLNARITRRLERRDR